MAPHAELDPRPGGPLTWTHLNVRGAFNELDTSLFAVIGVAAFLGAGYRVPLAAVMFVAEATGRPGFVVPGVIAAVVAELVMGRMSVTTFQLGLSGEPRSETEPAHSAPFPADDVG